MFKITFVKVSILLMGIVLFSSCTSVDNNHSSSSVDDSSIVEYDQQTTVTIFSSSDISNNNVSDFDLEKFEKEFLDMIDNKANPIELKKLLEDNVVHLKSSEITEFFEKLLLYVDVEAEEQNMLIFSEENVDLIWKYSEYISNPMELDKIDNLEFRNIIKNIYERGFIIALFEGYFPQVIVEYYSLFENFKNILTDEYTAYFNLLYFDNIFGAEGILVASVDELSETIHMQDMFLVNYPDSKYLSKIEGSYKVRLYTYLQPLFEYGAVLDNDIYTFGKEQIENYKYVILQYENTKFVEIIGDYLKILTKNNYVDNKESQEFRAKYLK